jgi:hypothetical protein
LATAKLTREFSNKDSLEWRERLENTLRKGWTGPNQTNQIIKEACVYSRVFLGLDWTQVQSWVVKTLKGLPGFKEHCNHQKDVERRVKDWVNSNKKSNRYFPYGAIPKVKLPKAPSNQERAAEAKQRILETIAQIHEMPDGVWKRECLIRQKAKCSSTTLRKYKDLWHPDFENQRYVGDCGERVLAFSEDKNFTPSDFKDRRCVGACDKTVSAISGGEIFASHHSESNFKAQGFGKGFDERVGVTSKDSCSEFPGAHDHFFCRGCVGADSEAVSASNDRAFENKKIDKTLIESAITHPALLSVVGGEELPPYDEQTKPKFKKLCEPAKQFTLRRQSRDGKTDLEQKIQINQIVRRKIDGANGPSFLVKKIDNTEQVWLQWINQPVPLVDIPCSIADLEIV